MCDNKVSFWTPRGKEILIQCGLTDLYGGRAICDECQANMDAMYQHMREEALIEEDNAWAESAGWGEF